jgi:sodium-independent sulfate anion transporter 11
MVAGFTVGLTVIPQAIAYSNVAGLPPQYGLYSSFMACFVYTIFGSCKDSPVGPTAIAAILTRENLHNLGPEFAVLLCFLSGCVELLMGILQLGFLIDFISGPVSVGFTSAAAIIIATTQIKDVLGLSFPGSKFLDVWEQLFEHISETRLWDTLLGFICMAVLLLLRKAKDIPVGPEDSKEQTKLQKAVSQFLWFISTARNILVVVVCAVMAYLFEVHGSQPFILTGVVKPGLPPFSPPPFSAQVGNHTYTFLEMASNLGSATFVVPLLAILENIALAKVFGKY